MNIVMNKVVLLVVLLIVSSANAWAFGKAKQDGSRPFSLYTNVDFMSTHIWRGGSSGTAPSLEPMLELSRGNLTGGVWAAATFDNSYKEIDLYLIYGYKNFTIGVFDYFCPEAKIVDADFLDLKGTDTPHLFSVDATYKISERIPVKFTASVMIGGMDVDTLSNNYYSTYLEAAYSKTWKRNTVSAAIGGTTHQGIYAAKAAIMNTELKYSYTFKIKDWALPVFAKLVHNPYKNKSYFLAGFSFNRGWKF